MHNGQYVVVIADDFKPTLDLLTRLFEKAGFSVRPAKDAIDALAEMDSEVDLVITDLSMPTLNGADLQDIIDQKYKIPVVMITGLKHIDMDDCQRRFDAVVKKPFDPIVFVEMVRAILQRTFAVRVRPASS
jgi:DNA-binding response OmpR family regulator